MQKKILVPFLFVCFLSSFYLKGQNKTSYTFYLKKGTNYYLKHKDSAYFYLNKAVASAERNGNTTYQLNALIYLIYSNGHFFDLKNFKSNVDRMGNILSCSTKLPYRNYYQNRHKQALGNYYYKIGQYEKAQTVFKKLLRFLKKNTKEEPFWKTRMRNEILVFLAATYDQMGKLKLAENCYLKALDWYEKNRPTGWRSRSAIINFLLAQIFEQKKQYKKAQGLIKKSISLYESGNFENTNKNAYTSAYLRLSKNYLKQARPKKTLSILRTISEKNLIKPENLKFRKDFLTYKARANAQKNDFETALQFYQEAIETTENYYQTEHHPETAELHKEIGELHAGQKQFEKSISHFQKALSALSENFKSKTFFDNPKPKSVLSKLTLTKILAAKQQTLAKAFEHKNNLEFLKAANQTAKSLVKTLDALKPEFEAKVDFQFLLEETFPAFDQMMQTAFLLHQKTGEKIYLNDAFYFAEKSKAVLLLSAVQNTNANQFVGVPDSVVVKEQQFRATINHLEKKQFKNPNDKVLQEELFNLKNDFYAFLDQLEIHYPKYHRLKFNSRVTGLSETQNQLKSGEALLEYYAAADFLYCFLVEKQKTHLLQIPLSEKFSEKTIHFQKLLSTPSVLKISKLKNLGNELRKKIIPELSPKISTLIIARSGLLNYIPFEALYNSKEKKYLIANYTVSYANSATLYQEYTKRPVSEKHRLLAFAPGFDNSSQSSRAEKAGLGPLLHNEEEVKQISNYFEGKILTDKAASLEIFEHSAKKFGILHLATHAIVNDQFPDYSYLAFSPKNSVNSLYIKDLYNYKLNADLVVLSACETGVGKLQKGAGMLSLAHGFNYAGANALVTTQWKINDQSATTLMGNFYKNLSEGQAKNMALRNAKIQYLKTTDDAMQRHPYYWAGFVLSGNTVPIVETSSWIWWISGVLFFVLIAATIVFWWKRNKCA
ncbi:MAG TPA: CHAT domain-containing tetratricopeptide repeat protein [Flavobacteriaceae bacterium]|nr:CHAT domain-containing tetratricopeptide repeat protein [Flavobacteriaceae bacterium]